MLNVTGGGLEIGADSSHSSWRVAYSLPKVYKKAEIMVGVGQSLLGLHDGAKIVSNNGSKSTPKRSKWPFKSILEASTRRR